jgi:hypothetical protein
MQVLPAVDWPPSLYRLRIPLRQALSQRSPQLGSPVDPWLDLVCAGRGTSSNSTLSSLNRDGSGGEPPAPQGYVPGEVATAFLQRTQKSGRILSPCSGIQKGLGLSLRKRFGCVGIPPLLTALLAQLLSTSNSSTESAWRWRTHYGILMGSEMHRTVFALRMPLSACDA